MKDSTIAETVLPRTWRSVDTHNKYEADRQNFIKKSDCCPLCEAKSIETFSHWRIIANRYPYDAIATRHEMIVPIRHCQEDELTAAELAELKELKSTYINEHYLYVVEAVPRTKSIPGHHHLHLMVPKTVG